MALLAPMRENKRWGFDLPWPVFVSGISLLTPQAYGVRIQNRFIEDFGLNYISIKNDAGDARDRLSGNCEVKSSILNESNQLLNIVQIRLFHDVQYYVVMAFDLRDNQYTPYLFVLTKQDMINECAVLGAGSAHGTVTANAHNLNVERRVSLVVDRHDVHFSRWLSQYQRLGTVIED
jgi:hypothetical protein